MCFTPPEPITLKIVKKDGGANLYDGISYKSSDAKLFYIENNIQTNVELEVHALSVGDTILYSNELA